MADVSPEAVQGAVDQGFTAEQLAKAEEDVARLSKPFWKPEEESRVVRVYCAIKQLTGDASTRIGCKSLEKLVKKVEATAAVKKTYWVVPREDLPDWVPKAALVDPGKFVLPEGFDAASAVLVDKKIKREDLPYGTGEAELALKQTWGSGPLGPSGLPALTAPAGARPLPDAPRPAKADGVETPAVAQTKVLTQQDSGEKSLEDTLEGMAQRTKDAAKNALWFSPDPRKRTTVEHWLGRFTRHAVAARWTGGANPQEMKLATQFVHFVVKSLVHHESLDFLTHMKKHLQEIDKAYPSMLPKTGKILLALCDHPPLSDTDVDMSALSLGGQMAFEDSAVYRQWEVKRSRAKFAAVKADAKTPDADRRALIVDMCEGTDKLRARLTPDEIHELEYSRAVLDPAMGLKALVVYLTGLRPGRGWELLREWAPAGRIAKLAPLYASTEMGVDEFKRISSEFPEPERSELSSGSAHSPVYDKLFEVWSKLSEVLPEGKLRDQVFLETFTYKTAGMDKVASLGAGDAHADGLGEAAAQVGGVICGLWKKSHVESAPPLTQQALKAEQQRQLAKAEEKRKAAEQPPGESAPKAAKTGAVGQPGAGESTATAPVAQADAVEKPEAGAGATAAAEAKERASTPRAAFRVGDVVLTKCKAKVDRPRLHDKRGRVTKVNARGYWVEILEGEEKGNRHEFSMNMVENPDGAESNDPKKAGIAESASPKQPTLDDLFAPAQVDIE